METILEQQRSYHEERERTMDAMVKEILHKKTGVSHNPYKSRSLSFNSMKIAFYLNITN